MLEDREIPAHTRRGLDVEGPSSTLSFLGSRVETRLSRRRKIVLGLRHQIEETTTITNVHMEVLSV